MLRRPSWVLFLRYLDEIEKAERYSKTEAGDSEVEETQKDDDISDDLTNTSQKDIDKLNDSLS